MNKYAGAVSRLLMGSAKANLLKNPHGLAIGFAAGMGQGGGRISEGILGMLENGYQIIPNVKGGVTPADVNRKFLQNKTFQEHSSDRHQVAKNLIDLKKNT